jgi:hypothetical protein
MKSEKKATFLSFFRLHNIHQEVQGRMQSIIYVGHAERARWEKEINTRFGKLHTHQSDFSVRNWKKKKRLQLHNEKKMSATLTYEMWSANFSLAQIQSINIQPPFCFRGDQVTEKKTKQKIRPQKKQQAEGETSLDYGVWKKKETFDVTWWNWLDVYCFRL